MVSIRGWQITRAGMLFIGVVIGLALLVAGGLYFAQQRGEQARRDEAVEIARQNLEEQSSQPVVIAEDQTAADEEASADREESETAPEALPETGPELAGLLGLFAIVFASLSFAASYRAARQL